MERGRTPRRGVGRRRGSPPRRRGALPTGRGPSGRRGERRPSFIELDCRHGEREDDEGDRVPLVLADERRRKRQERDEAEVDQVLRQQPAVLRAPGERRTSDARASSGRSRRPRWRSWRSRGSPPPARRASRGAPAVLRDAGASDLEDEQRHGDREDRVAEAGHAPTSAAPVLDACAPVSAHRARLQGQFRRHPRVCRAGTPRLWSRSRWPRKRRTTRGEGRRRADRPLRL